MKLETIIKNLDPDTLAALDSADADSLKATIITAESSLADAKEELENNPEYQNLKESLKALSGGYRDLKKRQTGKIQYALIRLKDKA